MLSEVAAVLFHTLPEMQEFVLEFFLLHGADFWNQTGWVVGNLAAIHVVCAVLTGDLAADLTGDLTHTLLVKQVYV